MKNYKFEYFNKNLNGLINLISLNYGITFILFQIGMSGLGQVDDRQKLLWSCSNHVSGWPKFNLRVQYEFKFDFWVWISPKF